jgi:hypothetical protein
VSGRTDLAVELKAKLPTTWRFIDHADNPAIDRLTVMTYVDKVEAGATKGFRKYTVKTVVMTPKQTGGDTELEDAMEEVLEVIDLWDYPSVWTSADYAVYADTYPSYLITTELHTRRVYEEPAGVPDLGPLITYNAAPGDPLDLSDTSAITVILDFELVQADSGAHIMLEHSDSSSANNGWLLLTESEFSTPHLMQLGSTVPDLGRQFGDFERPSVAHVHRMVWVADRTKAFAHTVYIDGVDVGCVPNDAYNVNQESTPFGDFHLFAGARASGDYPALVKMTNPVVLHHAATPAEVDYWFTGVTPEEE